MNWCHVVCFQESFAVASLAFTRLLDHPVAQLIPLWRPVYSKNYPHSVVDDFLDHGKISMNFAILRPIQRMTGTAIELPNALYLGLSGAGFPRYGTSVHPSGKPCSLSHSNGVILRTKSPFAIPGVMFVRNVNAGSPGSPQPAPFFLVSES